MIRVSASVILLSSISHRCAALVSNYAIGSQTDLDIQLWHQQTQSGLSQDCWDVGTQKVGTQSGPFEPKLDTTADDPRIECNTDSDCPIDADKNFRCMLAKGLKPTEKNNCRIAGVNPVEGNKTCLCSTMLCSGAPAPPKHPDKKQYLMIGDCITAYVRLRKEEKLLARGIELASSTGNAGSTNRALHCMDQWTQNDAGRHWDIISFNFGLHDVAYTTEHLTQTEYRKQFSKILGKLVAIQQRTGAKLLWISTTPIPAVPNVNDADCETPLSLVKCLSPPRRDKDVIRYNEIAARQVQKAVDDGATIATLDLHSKITDLCGGRGYQFCEALQMNYNAHFKPDGYHRIAEYYEETVVGLVKTAFW